MSDPDTAHDSTHAQHGDGHGHAPAGEPLGPIDVTAWAYAAGGSLLGLLVVIALLVARS